jgi:mannose-1-phosphate guanylyltransferase
MKAVILSGGLGTRLRPLTLTRPKPLLPLLNKPMVDHIVDRLPPEVDEVIMAANYLIDQLRDHFQNRAESGRGPLVRVVDEPEPRGTGGAVKNAEKYLDDSFYVFNGDIITSLDLGALRDRHSSKGGIGCLSLWKVDDPSRFGVIRYDGSDHITSFIEKPTPPPGEDPKPEWINAGVYIFEPAILDHIEPDRKVSFEREVFPMVLDKGLFAMPFEGYWVDAGKPADYLEAQKVLLDESPDMIPADGVDALSQRLPVMMGENTSIGPGALIGPYVTLGRDVIVGSSASVSDSVLMDGVHVEEGAQIKGALIGTGCRIGEGATVEQGCVLDHSEVVPGNSKRSPEQNRTE